MRALALVPDDTVSLVPAVRAALDGGPALLPFAAGRTAPDDVPAEVADRVAAVIRTSGSSGAPKSVALSADALLASASATEGVVGAGRWLLALPGHYVAGLQVVVRALVAGAEPQVLPPGPFTARAFAEALLRTPGDDQVRSALVPTQVHRLVEAAEQGDAVVADGIARLSAVLVGGGRLPAETATRAAAAGLRLIRTYGASETAGGCVYDGVPLPGVSVRVADGEVLLAGPVLADGYLGDPERSAAAFVDGAGGRWYRTGDAGEWDGSRLRISGRLDDVIISGGEKVSLGLVEQAVQALPGLAAAVVVRAPDPEWGEVPVVVATAQVALPPLRESVAARLGRAAAPRRVLVLSELPLLPSGKPDRRLLTALAAADGT